MTCASCGGDSTTRFCSYPCLVDFSRAQRGIECALCQWDPLLGRPGNENTQDICPGCSASPENRDWRQPSALERGTGDVDTTVQTAGGARLESVFGGRRKMDTPLAHRIIRISRWSTLRVRRRRNANGHPLRGWEWTEEPLTYREIAELVPCRESYVHRVMLHWLGR